MKAIQLSGEDTVATVLETVPPNTEITLVLNGKELGSITAIEEIPFGFKVCAKPMAKGDKVIKYGHPIGIASCSIQPGELVHIHNIEGGRGRGDLANKES